MGKTDNSVLFAGAAIGIAALHLLVSFFLGVAVGISPPNELVVGRVMLNILIFPLQLIPASFALPELISWLPWLMVSLAWGVGGALLLQMVWRSVSP